MRSTLPVLIGAALGLAAVAPAPWSLSSGSDAHEPRSAIPAALPNDNRAPAGSTEDGVLHLRLVAQLAAWRPDLDVDSAVTVQAFGETAGAPRIPGPLLRTTSGTEVRVMITNDIAASTLVVHGLRAGTQPDDTIHVRPGTTREITFRAGAPGTYLYWGSTTDKGINGRGGRDSQLTGAIVIDAPDRAPDPRERIFVITVIDIVPDTTKPPPHEDIWELAINGLAWPHSEPIEHAVGDTVRWRWLNGSYLPHPMHLHGFHFRVLAKGTGSADRLLPPEEVRYAVTEFMPPGTTFAMDWVPTRAGSWLFHCHMAPHISPYPERSDSARAHDAHDVVQHAKYGMAGLVLGIRSVERAALAAPAPPPRPAQHLRLRALERQVGQLITYGYALDTSDDVASGDFDVPGPPLMLTRGETTAITVVNETRAHTTVHWHGMELESVYDGVAGWSGMADAPAPLILPGDSFTVAFTPPRAGTYIYHTHMDETMQLSSGMYGAMIVLEPGARFEPDRELLFIVGSAVDSVPTPAINGRREPPVRAVEAGTTYRVRLINILPAAPVLLRLVQDSALLQWRPISKDGADLPAALRRFVPATQTRMGVGETYDFEWTPERPGLVELSVFQPRERWTRIQKLEVR